MSIITWGEGQGGVGAFDVKAGDIRASAETPLPASAVSWFPFISSWTLRGRNLGSVSLGLSRWGRVYTGEADSSLSGMKPGIGRWGGTVLVFLGEDLAAPDRELPAQRRGSTIERALTRYLFPGRTVLVVGNRGCQARGPCPHGTYDVGEAVKPTVTIQCDRGQAAGLWRSEHIARARSSDPGEAQGQFPRTAFYRPL